MNPLRPHASSGAVLFMVLILTVIMYLAASTLLIITMTEIHLADFGQRSTQAFYAAESGFVLGLSKLRTNPYYRTDTSETLRAGANTIMLSAEFYDGVNDGKGQYLKVLDPSLYRLIVRGSGTVPGSHASAKRKVERDVLVKPFVLFAKNAITLKGGSAVSGNIHANSIVSIAKQATVKGDVTSSVKVDYEDGAVDGSVSQEEPKIDLPEFPLPLYYPKYRYKGNEYSAKPVEHDTILLDTYGGKDPPVPSIDLYSGFPSTGNPAGVFYLDTVATGTPITIKISGTLLIPQPGMLDVQGAVSITPVDNFPALISAKNLKIDMIGGLEKFSKTIEKSRIQGLIYTNGNISLSGNDTTGEIITGSTFGQNITITGNPDLQITYDSSVYSDPPPGIDLIELGEWREVLE